MEKKYPFNYPINIHTVSIAGLYLSDYEFFHILVEIPVILCGVLFKAYFQALGSIIFAYFHSFIFFALSIGMRELKRVLQHLE